MRAALRAGPFVLGLALATGAAAAEVPGDKPGQPLPLPGGGTTRDLTQPGAGGVAGTGLGGSTASGGNAAAPGTGGSVKGPAGQGIDGQGVSTGIGTGTSGTGGSGTGDTAARP